MSSKGDNGAIEYARLWNRSAKQRPSWGSKRQAERQRRWQDGWRTRTVQRRHRQLQFFGGILHNRLCGMEIVARGNDREKKYQAARQRY
jgi:hypothetical protein